MTDNDCPVCNDEFTSNGAAKDHAWNAHDACHYCGETLDDEETLYVHWLAEHEGELVRTDQKRAETEVGELSIGDRLAYQGPRAAITGLSRRSLLIAGGATIAGGVATANGLIGGENTGDTDLVYQKSSAPTGTSVGKTAPDFELKTTGGETVSLMPAKKPTVVFFMAAWCSSCRVEEQNLKKIHDKYDDSVRIISVDIDPRQDSMADLRKFQENYGDDWIHAMGTEEVMQRYQLQTLDVTYLLNKYGVTVYKDKSVTDASTLDTHLKKLTK